MILERREFLKLITFLGGLALAAYLFPSCLKKEETTMTKISLVKTSDRTAGTRKAIELLKINPVKGKAVVLKPNFNTPAPAPVATHYDTLHSLIIALKEMGAKGITVAERSGPGDTTRGIMEKKGIFNMAKELGFDVLDMQTMAKNG